jgi:hypothetical protein
MDPQAPTRVNYFDGQLLDADDLRDEQDYHRGRHQRLGRLAVGSGVLCGLEVTVTGDGQVVVAPGIAIDGLGREIVVPAACLLADPFQPTDDDGQPRGEPVRDGTVTLFLCYAELAGDAQPVVPGAGEAGDRMPDRTVESFRIAIRDGERPPGPGLSTAQCDAFLPADSPRGFDRRAALREALDRSCWPPGEACVALASLTLSTGGSSVVVDRSGGRWDLLSAAQLLDLVLCLADRLTALEQAQSASLRQAEA